MSIIATFATRLPENRELKKWSRAKKIGTINRLKPTWNDLGADVLQDR
jgi:predicted GIY-YIG superfamily endonuclease